MKSCQLPRNDIKHFLETIFTLVRYNSCDDYFMLKRSVHIILALLLLISTTGFYVSRHYCGETLKSVTVNILPESCCGAEGCCHNETVTYKIDSDYSFIDFIFEPKQIASTIPFTLTLQTVDPVSLKLPLVYSDIPSPPRLKSYLAIIQAFLL